MERLTLLVSLLYKSVAPTNLFFLSSTSQLFYASRRHDSLPRKVKGWFHEPRKPVDESTSVVRLVSDDEKFGHSQR